MIKANAHKYSVSAMCKVLQIPRSTYYYESKQKPDENSLASEIREIFRQSRNNYGTRKLKVELEKKNLIVSRRRIGRIMRQEVWYPAIQWHSLSRTWKRVMRPKWKT